MNISERLSDFSYHAKVVKMKAKTLGMGITLAVLLATIGMGIAGAQSAGSATVTASWTSLYTPATCTLGVTDGTGAATTTLTAPGTLYVENTGSPDTNGVPSTMAVTVAYNDNPSWGPAQHGGWYLSGATTDVAGLYTVWTASGTKGVGGPYALDLYSSMVSAPTTMPAGTYYQQIVVSGSC
jgi:hypothetical protein